jgi:hypothetical protein
MDAVKRILRAAQWGMSLAVVSGCGGSTDGDGGGGDGGVAGGTSSGGTSSGGTSSGGTSSGGTSSGGTNPGGSGGISGSGGSQHLDPYPKEKLGCTGPEFDGGYYGQCCVKVGCFDPGASGECPAAENATSSIPGYPPGSGSCTCGEPTAGPYAPHEASEGACCYLFGSITCEGRPFYVASGETRVAKVVRRLDWV